MFDFIHLRSLVGRQLATYVVIGDEVGENGTRHLQGYAEFPNRLRFNQFRELLPNYHIEARRGDSTQASDYCKKDGNYEEYGTLSVSRQGNRTDIDDLHESLRAGKRKRTIVEEHFGQFLKYQRGINAAYNIYTSHRPLEQPPSIIVYYGRTGTGKTRSVWDNLTDISDLWTYSGNGWFDGYDQHPIALFDDFNGGEFKISYLLKVLDRYPMQVPVKGGFVVWKPTEIYLTSNLAPEEWFPNAKREHVQALLRRFTNVVYFQ